VAALPSVLREPKSLAGRTNLQLASLLAGMAITQTRTAIAHSISYMLTTRLGIPHGLACSFTLPYFLSKDLNRIAESAYEREMLMKVLTLLLELNLIERLEVYGPRSQILDLVENGTESTRRENYQYIESFSVDDLLKSLA
jgi:alcohol dehydrogenase